MNRLGVERNKINDSYQLIKINKQYRKVTIIMIFMTPD